MKRKITALLLFLVIMLSFCVPAAAFNTSIVGEKNILSGNNAYIDADGVLWMWGWGRYGHLGNGSTKDENPSPIRIMEDVVSVSSGSYHTAAIKTDGSLWMWGANEYGQLGNGGKYNDQAPYNGGKVQTVPVKVMDNVAAVSCGQYHTAAIKTDGSLWTWGKNTWGQLGNGGKGKLLGSNNQLCEDKPVKIIDNGVTQVACSEDGTAVVKKDGSLWMWGMNSNGQLGNNYESNALSDGGLEYQTVPIKIMRNVKKVACGNLHTLVIKTDSSLWTWGDSDWGQTGTGKYDGAPACAGNNVNVPEPMKIMDNVIDIACGNYHSAAIKSDGTLWLWGLNRYGQLGNGGEGDGDVQNAGKVQSVPMMILTDVAMVSAESGTIAIKKNGQFWAWGNNYSGGLGLGDTKSRNVFSPTQLKSLFCHITYANKQTVNIDGQPVKFQMYALIDENGNQTNYVKLRDIAHALNGTAAQFNVSWDGSVIIEDGKTYKVNGSEGSTPFNNDKEYYSTNKVATKINGRAAEINSFVLTDNNGGGYTYYQLRDLGKLLGFNVGWSSKRGIFIETDKPYTNAN